MECAPPAPKQPTVKDASPECWHRCGQPRLVVVVVIRTATWRTGDIFQSWTLPPQQSPCHARTQQTRTRLFTAAPFPNFRDN